jgi:hypothetical protein
MDGTHLWMALLLHAEQRDALHRGSRLQAITRGAAEGRAAVATGCVHQRATVVASAELQCAAQVHFSTVGLAHAHVAQPQVL